MIIRDSGNGFREEDMAKVMVIAGSASDLEKLAPCGEVLDKLGISWNITISSAHRSPERTLRVIREAEDSGVEVFICGAGMAAHLAGMVAAHTLRPVIGVPISGGALAGLDALLSTAQMPSGFPVATMALDKAGAANAGWLAGRILALRDEEARKRLENMRGALAEKVEADARKLAKKDAPLLA